MVERANTVKQEFTSSRASSLERRRHRHWQLVASACLAASSVFVALEATGHEPLGQALPQATASVKERAQQQLRNQYSHEYRSGDATSKYEMTFIRGTHYAKEIRPAGKGILGKLGQLVGWNRVTYAPLDNSDCLRATVYNTYFPGDPGHPRATVKLQNNVSIVTPLPGSAAPPLEFLHANGNYGDMEAANLTTFKILLTYHCVAQAIK